MGFLLGWLRDIRLLSHDMECINKKKSLLVTSTINLKFIYLIYPDIHSYPMITDVKD